MQKKDTDGALIRLYLSLICLLLNFKLIYPKSVSSRILVDRDDVRDHFPNPSVISRAALPGSFLRWLGAESHATPPVRFTIRMVPIIP